jgi:putative transposase
VPRLTDELCAQERVYNIKTVAASLRRQGLRAKASRRFSPVSYREHGLPVSENLLKQDFYTSGQNQKWVGDITYHVPGVQGGHGCSNEPRVCLEY